MRCRNFFIYANRRKINTKILNESTVITKLYF